MSPGPINVSTEVDIWPEDLKRNGYHHEDDCGSARSAGDDLDNAIDDLHRQAGHGDFPAYVCTQEPCRSLYLVPAGIAAYSRKSVA